jgi:hypothetical protein
MRVGNQAKNPDKISLCHRGIGRSAPLKSRLLRRGRGELYEIEKIHTGKPRPLGRGTSLMKIIGICKIRWEKMFSFQHEQASKCEGSTKIEVCGKKPDIAALQDLLNFAANGVSLYAAGDRKAWIIDDNVNNISFDIKSFL